MATKDKKEAPVAAPLVAPLYPNQEQPEQAVAEDNRGEAFEEPAQAPAAATEDTVVDLVVIPKSSSAVATLDDVSALMQEDAQEDLGFEKGDVALPFFRVLQSNSPQAKKQNPKYVEGAEAGSLFNTATNAVYDGMVGLSLIPVHFQRQATLWLPREGPSGGGFVREVPIPEAEALLKTCTKNEKGKDMTADGFELVFAAMYYCLTFNKVTPDTFEAIAFPLTSTQLKKARAWNAVIANMRLPNANGVGSYRPPMYGVVYTLTTIPESNNKGEWMGVKIVKDVPLLSHVNGTPTESFPGAAQLYLAARDFKALVGRGNVKLKTEDMREEGGAADVGSGVEDPTKLPF